MTDRRIAAEPVDPPTAWETVNPTPHPLSHPPCQPPETDR